MKENFKLKKGKFITILSYIISKVNDNLALMVFILMLIYFSGCSDEISTINENKSLTMIDGEDLSVKNAVFPHTLMVWGDNTFGQISNAPTGKFKALGDGGSFKGLALRWDNTPVLWGPSPFGPPSIPETIVDEKFNIIAIGLNDAVLISQNHTLAAFGTNELVTNVPSGYYQAVTVGSVHAVAISDDGTLNAWGSDSYLAGYGLVTGLLNVPEGGPFVSVKARVLCSLALHENGTLYGWGHPAHGINILDGWTSTPQDQNIFYIPEQKFKAIAIGNVHALAIRSNGTVTGWGDGSGGALNAPPHVRFKAVAAGWGFSIGLSTNGTLWGWGTPFKNPFATEEWTFASQGWTRFNNTDFFYVPDIKFESISAAAFHIMAITVGK